MTGAGTGSWAWGGEVSNEVTEGIPREGTRGYRDCEAGAYSSLDREWRMLKEQEGVGDKGL